LSWGSFLVRNLLPVTLGNILGGGFISLFYALIFPATTVKSGN
jgi:formate/nitrite transporter FocA (FNT family)